MDYHKALEHSFNVEKTQGECPPQSRLEYLSEHIFDFTTYDGGVAEHFGRKAVEVCATITDGKTFDYIKDPENYQWFLLMCNMPFFAERLTWGCSIRGAFWDAHPYTEFQSCGLWDGDEQRAEVMQFTEEEWTAFTHAVVDFAAPEMADAQATMPELPEPDGAIIALDKIARDYDSYEYGLPINANKQLPLADYTDVGVLEQMRSAMRSYGAQCFAAGVAAERARCEKIAWELGGNRCDVLAAAIRATKE